MPLTISMGPSSKHLQHKIDSTHVCVNGATETLLVYNHSHKQTHTHEKIQDLNIGSTLAHGSPDMHSAAARSRWCRCLRSNAAGRPPLAGLEQDMSSGCSDCPAEEWTADTCRESKMTARTSRVNWLRSTVNGTEQVYKKEMTEREKRAHWKIREKENLGHKECVQRAERVG